MVMIPSLLLNREPQEGGINLIHVGNHTDYDAQWAMAICDDGHLTFPESPSPRHTE